MYQINFNQKLIYGIDSLAKIHEIVLNFGRRVLIVTSKNSAKKSGGLDKLINLLKESGCKYFLFNEVKPNPTVELVNDCRDFAKENACEVIIGIGGGSSIDTAKAVSVMLTNEGSVEEYLEIGDDYKKIVNSPIPMIAIPTTAGTGSEATKNAVMSVVDKKLKRSIRDERLVPKVVILDPTLLQTVPDNVLSSSAMDALTQLIEPYTGKRNQPIVDMLALEGIKLLINNLPKFLKNKQDFDAAMNLMLASYYSGISLANSGLGLVHALSRPFGGIYNLPHGMVCAILLPYVTRENINFNLKRYAKIGIAMGFDRSLSEDVLAQKVVDKIFELNDFLGIPKDFKMFNIPKEDIDKIIEDAKGGSMQNNPKEFTNEELKKFLLRIL